MYCALQHARENLTTGNELQGQCMICLEELSTGGEHVFTATSCYHFFHWSCISSYVEHCRSEFEDYRKECKSNISSPAEEDGVFKVCIQEPKYNSFLGHIIGLSFGSHECCPWGTTVVFKFLGHVG